MFTFVEVSKNTYPYRTLHVDTCSVLKRAKYQSVLTLDEVRRRDSVRIDYCSRCMPVTTVGSGTGERREYSEAQRSFWGIQAAFKAEEANTWRMVHAARKVVALRLALEEAEAALDMSDPTQVEFLAITDREVRAGEQNALSVEVSGR